MVNSYFCSCEFGEGRNCAKSVEIKPLLSIPLTPMQNNKKETSVLFPILVRSK